MKIPFSRSKLLRFFPARHMRKDWDLRAKENAKYFIDCGHSGSEEDFWRSGQEDLAQSVLRDIELSKTSVAVEIGCGIGRILRPISEQTTRAVGFDISKEMIDRGLETLKDRPNIELFLTDGALPELGDASVDFVYSFIVFQHIPSKKAVGRYLSEASRVLRGAGVFRFQVDGRRDNRMGAANTWSGVRYSSKEMKQLLAKNRFELVDQSGVGTQYYWLTVRRETEDGRPSTSSVTCVPKTWAQPQIERLFDRLHLDKGTAVEQLMSGKVSLRDLSEPFFDRVDPADPKSFVTEAYRVFLDREPDTGGLQFYSEEIAEGIDPTNIVDCLIASPEFDEKYRLKLDPESAEGTGPEAATP